MLKSTAQETRDRIAAAALETLREEGFAGTTSRAIARRGGFNQALIFYHYGSVESVLLEALRRSSEERLARYRERVAGASGLEELLPVLAELHEEDRESGHMRVVAQLVGGSLGRPELGQRVLRLMEPWAALAEETLARVLAPELPARELAYAVVTFYFGLNLIAHLDPADRRADALFEHAGDLVALSHYLLPRPGTSPAPES
jgi:AcrR family transcriptional regulator